MSELVIPDWTPVSVNVIMRLHWSRRNRRLKADADVVGAYALIAATPFALAKRRVTLTFHVPAKRLPDPDNLLKSCLDALVKNGLLVDDSSQWCDVTARVVRGPRQTVITLEDVTD